MDLEKTRLQRLVDFSSLQALTDAVGDDCVRPRQNPRVEFLLDRRVASNRRDVRSRA